MYARFHSCLVKINKQQCRYTHILVYITLSAFRACEIKLKYRLMVMMDGDSHALRTSENKFDSIIQTVEEDSIMVIVRLTLLLG